MTIAEYDLRHLAGQHDQSTHGRGGGSGDAPAGEPASPEVMLRLATGGLIDGTYETSEPGAVDEITNAQRGYAKELAAASVASRMTSPTDALIAEAEAARRRRTDYAGAEIAESDERFAVTVQPADTQWGNVWLVARRPEGGVEVHPAMDIVDFSLDPDMGTYTRDTLMGATDADGVLRGSAAHPDMYIPRDSEWAVAGTPAAERMARESAVSDLIDNWARSSNDNNARSLAIQKAAEDEFGLVGSATWPTRPNGLAPSANPAADALYSSHGPVYRDFLRAQYEGTQESLAAAGVTSLKLYRGVKPFDGMPSTGDGVTVQVRPMSSWSYDYTTAANFAGGPVLTTFAPGGGRVISAVVPASRVLSIGRDGVGCLSEGEVVVLGPTVEDAYVWKPGT